jgi:hypothetical protein
LPSDYLSIIDVADGDRNYKIESGYLLYRSPSVYCRYVWDNTTVSAWDDMFVHAIASYLAELSCVAITGSDSRMDEIEKYRRRAMGESRNRDSQETGRDPPVPDEWVVPYLGG